MTRQKSPSIDNEESPERIADYHRGADNSIQNVMRGIKQDQARKGVELSGVDDKDIDEIKEPGTGKPPLKAPPARKTPR